MGLHVINLTNILFVYRCCTHTASHRKSGHCYTLFEVPGMGALIIDLPYCFMRGLGTISMTCHIECDSENGPGLVEHDGVAYIVTNPPGDSKR